MKVTRTGKRRAAAINSVKVLLTSASLAPTAARAEVAAKTALILGSQKGLAWLAARPELAGCLVLEDGRLARTESLAAYTPVID